MKPKDIREQWLDHVVDEIDSYYEDGISEAQRKVARGLIDLLTGDLGYAMYKDRADAAETRQ